MKAQDIAGIVSPVACRLAAPDDIIVSLLTDSRRLSQPNGTLFFAIPTTRNSGARYIPSLYEVGVRSFVVPEGCKVDYSDANVWQVPDVVEALQRVAAWRRRQFDIPVIGITGSNGKTIVKDWLVQLLSPDGRVTASPKSYNSQIGVPLSVWQLDEGSRMAVFEAGISKPGEMTRLEEVIQPTIGLITNIGRAHGENFASIEQKTAEKLRLFVHCQTLVYCADHKVIASALSGTLEHVRRFTWGMSDECDVQLLAADASADSTTFKVRYGADTFTVTIPFADRASQENAMHCLAVMLLLGYRPDGLLADRMASLAPVEMRLEINQAQSDSLLINDSYSLDINSLTIALDYMNHIHGHGGKTLVISDMLQAGIPDGELYSQVADLVRSKGVTRLVAIGPAISACYKSFQGIDASFYTSTQEFIDSFDPAAFANQTILLKGARPFAFERIAPLLQLGHHETVMEVNLDALTHNLNYHRSLLKPTTKLMAMVKAASYGAGRVEVASALQFNHVDYLTVAYADEGVLLRRAGISLPIMVMNPEEATFDDIVRFRLEPDIYSFRILDLFAAKVESLHSAAGPYPIHIEFDTGMHRLGFVGSDRERLDARLRQLEGLLSVQSVFSHLACADDPSMDDVTRRQIALFRQWSDGMPGLKHILNSSGITRFPEAQMDMVRLGIGLYGVSPEPEIQARLRQVSRLVSRISQIKEIPQGDTVGYGGRWRASRPSRIAIVTIGYADGLHRGLGYGRGRVLVAGHEAPIIGSVCMDMCFLDVTDIDCHEGDTVVIFGDGDLLQRNAAAANTIPYELLTAVSPRVQRLYFHEE